MQHVWIHSIKNCTKNAHKHINQPKYLCAWVPACIALQLAQKALSQWNWNLQKECNWRLYKKKPWVWYFVHFIRTVVKLNSRNQLFVKAMHRSDQNAQKVFCFYRFVHFKSISKWNVIGMVPCYFFIVEKGRCMNWFTPGLRRWVWSKYIFIFRLKYKYKNKRQSSGEFGNWNAEKVAMYKILLDSSQCKKLGSCHI